MSEALFRRTLTWLRLTGEFMLAQGVTQVAGLISGLIYVRILPIEHYALFGLSMTAINMMAIGSDLGLTGSLSYFWRKSLQDEKPFSPTLVLVRRMRNILFLLSVAVGAIMLFSASMSAPYPYTLVLLCFSLSVVQVWLQMTNAISVQVIRLEGRQRTSYFAEAWGGIVRLAVATIMYLSAAASVLFALVGGLLGAAATTEYIRRRKLPSEASAIPSQQDREELRLYFISVLPMVLVFILRDPLVMWLTATRAGTTAVADVFALSRIAVFFAIIGSFANIVFIPRLAAIVDNRCFAITAVNYFAAQTGICLALVLITIAFPSLPLLLIGSKYGHLTTEVVILALSASINLLAGFLVTCARVHGWVGLDPPLSALQLVITVVACLSWRFSSTADVLYLNLLLAAVGLAVAAIIMLVGWRAPHLVKKSDPLATAATQ